MRSSAGRKTGKREQGIRSKICIAKALSGGQRGTSNEWKAIVLKGKSADAQAIKLAKGLSTTSGKVKRRGNSDWEGLRKQRAQG